MTTVYIVSFYTNITKIGTRARSFHSRFTQSNADKESYVALIVVLIRCCKWISFRRAKYNHYQ